jgi:prepilin-type N-terminal cleavage/methylation domain-containing protein
VEAGMAGTEYDNSSRGFSLTELIIVIFLISVILAIATLNFNHWQRKYNIEAQVKEMLSDLTAVRQMAIQTKKRHRVTLNPKMISFRRYSSESDATGTPVFNRNLNYTIQKFSEGTLSSFSDTDIKINDRGYTESVSDNMTIAVGVGLGEPAYNCLVVHYARVNVGKINGNSCEFQ